MPSRYISKFSGEEIDHGIEAAIRLEKIVDHVKLDSTVDDKYDINHLLDPGIYDIDYYVNSYDDQSTQRPISVHVVQLSNGWIQQSYQIGAETVYRYYSVIDKIFKPWQVMSDIVSVNHEDEVEVSKPTIVLRHGGDNITVRQDPTTI